MKYRAFISYSHVDERWAIWLQNQLERYRVPRRLIGRPSPRGPIPARLGKMFRDRTELPSASHLGNTLLGCLKDSAALIVICSPECARSRWVGEEIRQFRALGRADDIYALIVSGKPNAEDANQQCFPAALTHDDAGNAVFEPLAASIPEDGKADARLKIIAGLLGVGLDELRQRELQRRNRNLAIITGLSMSVAVITIGLAIEAYRARNEATQRRAEAEDLINFMLGDLRDRLDAVGRLDVLDAVDKKVVGYFDGHGTIDKSDTELLARAKASREISEIRQPQGNSDQAAKILQQAVSIDESLLRKHPKQSIYLYELLKALDDKSNFEVDGGDLSAADRTVTEATALLGDQDEQGRKTFDWQMEKANAEANFGQISFQTNNKISALGHFRNAISIYQRLRDSSSQNGNIDDALFRSALWEPYVLSDLGRIDEAQAAYKRQVELARALVAGHPGDNQWQTSLFHVLSLAGTFAKKHGDLGSATPLITESVDLAQRLSRLDPDNVRWKGELEATSLVLAELRLFDNRFGDALEMISRSVELAEQVFRHDPSQILSRARYSDALLTEADFGLVQGLKDQQTNLELKKTFALWTEVAPSDGFSRRTLLRAHLLALELNEEPIAEHQLATEELLEGLHSEDSNINTLELQLRASVLKRKFDDAIVIYTKIENAGFRSAYLEAFLHRSCATPATSSRAFCAQIRVH